MNILLCIIFLFAGLMIVLVSKFAYESVYHYKNGMIHGIHIPQEHMNDTDIKNTCDKAYGIFKRAQIINAILAIAICGIAFINTGIFIMIWSLWLCSYLLILTKLKISYCRKMYRFKEEKGLVRDARFDEKEGRTVQDDDAFWKKGWYNNPDDRRIMVKSRTSDTSYVFNYGRPAGKILTGLLALFIAGTLIYNAILLAPYINVRINAEVTGTSLELEGADYNLSIKYSEIKEVELLEDFPDIHFSKIEGGSTDEYRVGKFKNSNIGKCMLFLYNDYTPLIRITTDDTTVFFNGKDSDKITTIYNSIKQKITEGNYGS